MDLISLKYIAIGLMSIAMFGAAMGVSNIFSSLINSISRNPSIEDKVAKYALIGAGMTEAIGLFALVISLILIFN